MTKNSSFRSKETTHITRVLEVSTVDLWAAEAYFVIATPVALKQAIDTMIPSDSKTILLFLPIYSNASAESSRYPYVQNWL